MQISIKYNGKVIKISDLDENETILDLKNKIARETSILPDNQKILGFTPLNNAKIEDETKLSDFKWTENKKLMLIGSTELQIKNVNENLKVDNSVASHESESEDEIPYEKMPVYLDKVQSRIDTYKIETLNPPRKGKKLLVLDIDYTIFDHISSAQNALLLARPHLFDFLSRSYEKYDIAFWSATSMTWILAKLTELGIIGKTDVQKVKRLLNENQIEATFQPANKVTGSDIDVPFKVLCLVDSGGMISVHLDDLGVKEVKPLAVIWNKYPEYGPHNTIMFDDCSRNFIMNPKNGLKIKSYRNAHENCHSDNELSELTKYLDMIFDESDFTKLRHSKWKRFIEKHSHKRSKTSEGSLKVKIKRTKD